MHVRVRRTATRSAALPRLALSLVLAAAAVAARAQLPAPVRGQFQVNHVVQSSQQVPDAGRGAFGASTVVWESYSSAGNDASGRSIQARRYHSAGGANGAQFQVNTQIVGEQTVPKVAVAPDGRFAIVWQSDEGGGGPANLDIRGRVYSPAGVPLGADFVINTFVTGEQRYPDAAWGGNDLLVVVWESDDDASAAGFDWNIVGRAYNAAGAPVSGEFLVNTLAGNQFDPEIAGHASGNFVVAWESSTSAGPDNTTQSIQVRVLGGPAEEQVNDHAPDVADDNPAVAVSDAGDILVAWESWGSAGDDDQRISIQARLYTDVTGPVFQANSYTTDDQRFPTAGFHPDGRFVIGWQSYGSAGGDASEFSVQVRGFAANGTPLGADRQANAYTSNNQRFPALAMDGRGDILLAWESIGSAGGDADGASIQARRFSLDLLFLGDFEPGNLSGWSSSVP